jgi:ribosome-binding protein aMBF1 (putative translation factor)
MKPKRPRTTSDGLAMLDRRHFEGRPGRLRALADAQLNAQIAQEIYALRTKAGLTQKQLAKLVGTTDSVVSRLEDADYTGHSLKMLQRIGAALNRRLEIHFAPLRGRRKSAQRSPELP